MTVANRPMGTCPVCNGTARVPVPIEAQSYKKVMASYDEATDTFACSNCGGQYQWGGASGRVQLNKVGQPCMHEYEHTLLGRCLHGHICKHCDDYFTIDSGD